MKGYGGVNCEIPLYCTPRSCGFGRCFNLTNELGIRCECPRGFTPETRCSERDLYKMCTEVGLIHDPTVCHIYYECKLDGTQL